MVYNSTEQLSYRSAKFQNGQNQSLIVSEDDGQALRTLAPSFSHENTRLQQLYEEIRWCSDNECTPQGILEVLFIGKSYDIDNGI